MYEIEDVAFVKEKRVSKAIISKHRNSNNVIYIYALISPKTSECRYVGKTNNIEKRYKNHCFNTSGSKTQLYRWLDSLKPLKPKIEVLEIVPPGEDWIEAEQFWIAYMKALGARLSNHGIGGEGSCGIRRTEEFKIKASERMKGNTYFLGLNHSEETKIKLSKSKKGKKKGLMSDEHKFKLSLSKKGHVVSEEAKINLSKALKGRIISKEHRAKISKALTGRKLSKETILKRELTRKLNKELSYAA